VIESFRCPDTGRLFRRERVARFVNIESAARRRLDALEAAATLRDLLARPSNRREGSAYDVEIVDYH
jgi:proteic killer suppression protein